MSQLRKIVKVEPVPWAEPLEHFRNLFYQVADGRLVDDLVAYSHYTVTYDCGHTEQWLNRPKREQYACDQCE